MKCVIFLVAMTILCHMTTGSSLVRNRRGYDGYNAPSRGRDYYHRRRGPEWGGHQHYPGRPAHYGPFEMGHRDSDENSSEEITSSYRPTMDRYRPNYGYGGGSSKWWGTAHTTESPTTPLEKSNTDGTLSKEEQISACIKSCPVTTEYNPVCGSNNVTYPNPGRLACEQKCGVAVQLSRLTACTVSEPTISREEILACIKQCPVSAEYSPVCGNNNVTYVNQDSLECERRCGIPVKLSSLFPCFPEVNTTEKTLSREEQIAACMRLCTVTSEYNPVCGSDNVTYQNPGRLECAQNCGLEVRLTRKTSCVAPLTEEEEINATSDFPNTTSTTEASQVTTSTTTCPYVNGNGKDGLIASNEENSLKVKSIGNNCDAQNILREENNGKENDSDYLKKNMENDGNEENNGKRYNGGGGGHKGGNNGYQGNNCNGENTSKIKKKPNLSEVMACMQLCPLTSEFNVVCGTDGISYTNPGRLLCAQFCGIDVKVKKFGQCSSTSGTTFYCPTFTNPPVTNPPVTENPGKVTPSMNTLLGCLEACPASEEFKPVCGSNNITYKNLERLQCAKRCGVDVTLIRKSDCAVQSTTTPNYNPPIWANTEKPDGSTSLAPNSIQECIMQCNSVDQKYEPICGTDNVTYNNKYHLICARQCGLDVRLKYSRPCSNIVSTTPKPSTGLNFTIPIEVLESVWGFPASISTTPKDESEEFDLDERLQDKV